jgi:Fe-S cluster assembly protein SufB
MAEENQVLKEFTEKEYAYGWSVDIEADELPMGLNEDIVRAISAKKNEPEWLTEWRLKAYRHWLTMEEPEWAHIHYPKVDFQNIIYYSAPKKKPEIASLDEVDPEMLATFEKLGISLEEQKRLLNVAGSNVAVDAVFDSVSVKTTFRETLREKGVIFCSFSEAVRNILSCAAVPRLRGAHDGQLLRGAQQRRVQRRVVLLHPQGRALSHGTEHLLPHQRHEHRAV